MPNISQIPLSKVPFLDERTGLVSREWYRFLNNLFTLTGGGSTDISLSDILVGPSLVYTDHVAESMRSLDGLWLHPQPTPHASEARYGEFYSTSSQTAAATGTAYGVTWGVSELAKGVTIGATTSRLYVDRPGVYAITAALRLTKTGGAGGTAITWLRKNGVDVAASGVSRYVTTTNPEASQPAPFMLEMAAGDYVEVMWGVDATTIQLTTVAAAAPYPALPSARVRVSLMTG